MRAAFTCDRECLMRPNPAQPLTADQMRCELRVQSSLVSELVWMIVSWCAATTGREVRQARPGLIELVVLGLSAAFSSDRECLLRPNPAQPLWVGGERP